MRPDSKVCVHLRIKNAPKKICLSFGAGLQTRAFKSRQSENALKNRKIRVIRFIKRGMSLVKSFHAPIPSLHPDPCPAAELLHPHCPGKDRQHACRRCPHRPPGPAHQPPDADLPSAYTHPGHAHLQPHTQWKRNGLPHLHTPARQRRVAVTFHAHTRPAGVVLRPQGVSKGFRNSSLSSE